MISIIFIILLALSALITLICGVAMFSDATNYKYSKYIYWPEVIFSALLIFSGLVQGAASYVLYKTIL